MPVEEELLGIDTYGCLDLGVTVAAFELHEPTGVVGIKLYIVGMDDVRNYAIIVLNHKTSFNVDFLLSNCSKLNFNLDFEVSRLRDYEMPHIPATSMSRFQYVN